MSAASEVVTLNVGGRLIQTRRDTLRKMPMVDRLLDFPGEDTGNDSSDRSAVFLDRDPDIFAILLGLARGWPTSILDTLTPYQRAALLADADYLQMDMVGGMSFTFKLAQSNKEALIDGCVYTVGRIHHGNTILGDRALPDHGRFYWEVTITSFRDTNDGWDAVGVAHPGADTNSSLVSQKGAWCWCWDLDDDNKIYADGSEVNTVGIPRPKQGSVIGVDFDRGCGSLRFWLDRRLVGLAATDISGDLYPAFSVNDTTVMKVTSSVSPPTLQ